MKTILIFFTLIGIAITSFAQENNQKFIDGSITVNGKVIEGYLWKKNGNAPWDFQKEVRFITYDGFKKLTKVKFKYFNKYGPKDCEGYTYEGTYYEAVKYADMSAAGAGMIAKRMFMKQHSLGKITLYEFFQVPPSITTGNTPPPSKTGTMVYRKGKEGKLKAVKDIVIKKEFADCPLVLENYEKGDYNFFEEDDSGLIKALSKTAANPVEVRMLAIADYNENCGKEDMK
ncbi:hypothetical protein [Flammeovirga aprica]|uniref:Uncharacterized protein n=1 Tax=Flammeovirga aprica JL-4 TaxID=694437 RepID=A0A7X9RV12_9BACT|nr:hypothetical protein [Flammeovirga aprica]NME69243.1 hypothetical protein [Flammeovirga aprica JL-4]